MHIAFHIGLHCTDEDRLVKTLIKNRELLIAHKISIPGPSRYRPLIRQSLRKLRGQPASEEAQDVLLDAILEDDNAERLVLSNEHFMGGFEEIHGQNLLYPTAGQKLKALRNLFPSHQVSFHFAVKDLATFFPSAFRASEGASFGAFMGQCDLRNFSWTELVKRMRAAVPDAELVAWAHEDAPLLWPDILEAITGHPAGMMLLGRADMLGEVLTTDGFRMLVGQLGQTPPVDVRAYDAIVAPFLERHIDPTKLEEEIKLPGWTEKVVGYLSSTYDPQLAEIARIRNLELISDMV